MSSEERARALVEKALRTQLRSLVRIAEKANEALNNYNNSYQVIVQCSQEFSDEVKKAQESGIFDVAHLKRITDIKKRQEKAEHLLLNVGYEKFFDAHHKAWLDVTDYIQLLERLIWTRCRFSDSFIAEMRKIKKENPFSEEKLRASIRDS